MSLAPSGSCTSAPSVAVTSSLHSWPFSVCLAAGDRAFSGLLRRVRVFSRLREANLYPPGRYLRPSRDFPRFRAFRHLAESPVCRFDGSQALLSDTVGVSSFQLALDAVRCLRL